MFNKIKSYVQDQVSLAKLESVERMGKTTAAVVYMAVALVFSLFFILLLSLAGAFFISYYYDEFYGFLIMAGIYLLILILLFVFKKSIQNAVANIVISSALNKK